MPRADALVTRLAGHLQRPRASKSLATTAKLGAVEVLSAPIFSQMVGRLTQTRRVPKPMLLAALKAYVRAYNVDLSEVADPLEHFDSFDAFFTRRLREGVHTIDPRPDVAVSPVDGRVLSMGRVSEGRIDQVKGRSYGLDELLDSPLHARRFQGGWFITLYLSPRDYHRIHCPIDGAITGYRYVPGRLYPVNQLGVNHIDKVFATNERIVSFVDGPLGEVAVVKVGATNVGMITLSYQEGVVTNRGRKTAYDAELRKRHPVARGDELGRFHLGSTVVLLVANPALAPLEGTRLHDFKRMGAPLMQLTEPSNQ